MAVTFAVYDELEDPSVANLQTYLNSIAEFEGRPANGMVQEYPFHVNDLFKGRLFRCNDDLIHSDDFFIVIMQRRNQNTRPISDAWLLRFHGALAREVQFWTTELGATEAGTGKSPTGATIIKMKVDPRKLSDLTAKQRRETMKAVTGSKA